MAITNDQLRQNTQTTQNMYNGIITISDNLSVWIINNNSCSMNIRSPSMMANKQSNLFLLYTFKRKSHGTKIA